MATVAVKLKAHISGKEFEILERNMEKIHNPHKQILDIRDDDM